MRKSIVVIGVMLMLLFLNGCGAGQVMDGDGMYNPVSSYTKVSQDFAKEMMARDDGHIIVDVRTQEEYATGHIPGAICIPNESINTEQPEDLPDKEQIILVYCRSGRRSKEAAQKLFDIGYSNVYEFGGIIDWTGDIVTEEVVGETTTDEEVNDDSKSEEFLPELPVHLGMWEVRSWGQLLRYYEFSDQNGGRTVGVAEEYPASFTYQDAGDQNLILKKDNGEETAHYNFSEDGKHLVLTFQDRQEELIWISHGTLEDIGALGLTITSEDVTPTGCTLAISQQGGYPTGEITINESYSLMIYDEEAQAWGVTSDFGDYEDTMIVDRDGTVRWKLDWAEEYGVLSPGRHLISFQVRDVRNKGGDWDHYQYYVVLQIPDAE